MLKLLLSSCGGLLIVGATSTVWAQDGELGDPIDYGQTGSQDEPLPGEGPGEDTGRLGDEQAITTERLGVEQHRDSTDPWEDPQEGYYFVGLFYRHIFIPEFLMKLFLDEASGASNPAFGAEVTYRKDNFDIIGSLWWASFSADGAFRASGDPATDTEMIDSGLSAIFLSGTFLWSTPFNDVFALEYGVSLGVGVVLGDLVRTEAYPTADGGWGACQGVGSPGPNPGPSLAAGHCDGPSVRDGEDGGHYGVVARKWSDGGSVPNVVPWLAVPQLALRIKPIKQLMMRVEGGFGLGFFLGAAINYGF